MYFAKICHNATFVFDLQLYLHSDLLLGNGKLYVMCLPKRLLLTFLLSTFCIAYGSKTFYLLKAVSMKSYNINSSYLFLKKPWWWSSFPFNTRKNFIAVLQQRNLRTWYMTFNNLILVCRHYHMFNIVFLFRQHSQNLFLSWLVIRKSSIMRYLVQ